MTNPMPGVEVPPKDGDNTPQGPRNTDGTTGGNSTDGPRNTDGTTTGGQ
jgi:hypothetical protein